METIALKVVGMSCGGCSGSLEKKLKEEAGVAQASASHTQKSATVTFDPAKTTMERLKEIVEDAGFDVQ